MLFIQFMPLQCMLPSHLVLEGTIENSSCDHLRVDFANAKIGGGVSWLVALCHRVELSFV